MKQTEIYYRKINSGAIRITDFKNVLSKEEISEKFGKKVMKKYLANHGNFYYLIDYRKPTLKVLIVSSKDYYQQISISSIIDKQRFTEIINTMKEAGERLRQIIKKHKTAEGEIPKFANAIEEQNYWQLKGLEKEKLAEEANKKINIPIKKIGGDNDFFKIELNLNINEMIKIMPVHALNDLRKKITDEIATRNIVKEQKTKEEVKTIKI